MVKEHPLLGIDVGATNIKCAMGVKGADYIDIISVYTLPTLGIRDGLMEDADSLIDVIKQGMLRAEVGASCKPKEALISISSRHFYTLDSSALIPITEGHVTHKDILRLVQACHQQLQAKKGSTERTDFVITHTLPQQFFLDEQVASLSPWGQPAFQMKLNAHLIYGHQKMLNRYWEVGKSAGLPLKDVMCGLLVQSEGLLSRHDLEGYVSILDLGSETTKVMIFHHGRPIYFHSRFQGGLHLTKEIQHRLKVSFDDAENLKLQYGAVRSEIKRDSDRIPIYGEEPMRYIPQERLIRIIERSLTENLSAIRVRLEKDGMDRYLEGGIILSGGGANIEGLDRLTSEILRCAARVGKPQNPGTTDLVQAPQYATVNGLILAGLRKRYDGWFSSWQRPISSIPSPHQPRFIQSSSWWNKWFS